MWTSRRQRTGSSRPPDPRAWRSGRSADVQLHRLRERRSGAETLDRERRDVDAGRATVEQQLRHEPAGRRAVLEAVAREAASEIEALEVRRLSHDRVVIRTDVVQPGGRALAESRAGERRQPMLRELRAARQPLPIHVAVEARVLIAPPGHLDGLPFPPAGPADMEVQDEWERGRQAIERLGDEGRAPVRRDRHLDARELPHLTRPGSRGVDDHARGDRAAARLDTADPARRGRDARDGDALSDLDARVARAPRVGLRRLVRPRDRVLGAVRRAGEVVYAQPWNERRRLPRLDEP